MPRKSTYRDEFIAIDFEIANSAYYSACSIGIVKVVGREIIEKISYLIQPPDNYYNNDTMAIHGIKPEDTKDADLFPVIWDQIKHFFDDTFVTAHNANFDMSVLKASLNYYNIEFPNFSYFCSIPVSGLNIEEDVKIPKSLEARCQYYNIPLENHHDALCDATACANLVLYALNNSRYRAIDPLINVRIGFSSFEDVKLKKTFKKPFYDTTTVKNVAATIEVSSEKTNIKFFDKVFVFTGELKNIPRENAYAKVISGGGKVSDGLTQKVDILVNAGDTMSGKLKRALELQEKGHKIKIINDNEFMEMVNS